MEWLINMNNAICYIERNLAGKVSYEHAAQVACSSTYHFTRMFSYITGVPLSEYIRRRRLTLAALDLQTSDIKVIDVAAKYGYDSPEAFSRAFKKLHGVMPISAREVGVQLKTFPKMTLHIKIKGDTEMIYRIEEKDAFEVFGIELRTTVIDGKCFEEIPQFAVQCMEDGRYAALLKAAGKGEDGISDVGVTYGHNPNGNMNYLMGCFKTSESIPSIYTVLSAPKQTWAVFAVDQSSNDEDTNMHNIHETWRRIYSEWFPTVSYEHTETGFDFEWYLGDNESGYGVEIWIPVVKNLV
ncbi:MAG: AraC family transcriptional regulator [Defluviitaleaceae bacterium]|nr:AraC family transcriptional regulator [Defluviitaleaceae bacterium]